MHLHHLSIFSKDTDATETVRGYEFQKLRTVENWLDNYLAKTNAVIYCDYEEDIFLRNQDTWLSSFTQLKLYSSKNFSFSSIEVTKAISHFFMLFVKGDYKWDKLKFIFETNASIANTYGDNDAKLLQNWKKNQKSMDAGLLDQCAAKVRNILIDYATKIVKDTKDEIFQNQLAQHALQLEKLDEQIWKDFARSIKWIFTEKSAEQTMSDLIETIYAKIVQTNFPAAGKEKESIFTKLYYAVADRSIQSDPEQRKLDLAMMDHLLISAGDEADKGYDQDYQAWSTVSKLVVFRHAEFYQVVNASTHCRYSVHLQHHRELWMRLLEMFIPLEDIPERDRLKAIYELLWAAMGPITRERPRGSLLGKESYIELFFEGLKTITDRLLLRDAVSLLGTIQPLMHLKKVELSAQQVIDWRHQVLGEIAAQLASSNDPNLQCYLHELAAELLLQASSFEKEMPLTAPFQHYNAILPLLPQASWYDVTLLQERLNGYVEMMIEVDLDIAKIEVFENYIDQLMPFVSIKKNARQMAEIHVARGSKYHQSKDPISVLRALEEFHKARQLCRHDEQKEGYIRVLLAIAQLHINLGNLLAGKYHALCAGFHASQLPEHHHLMADAFSLALMADYHQGAWASCFADYQHFMQAAYQYRPTFMQQDEVVQECTMIMATLMVLAPKVSPQLIPKIEALKEEMKGAYAQFIAGMIPSIENMLSDKNLEEFIRKKFYAVPLSDIGPTRSIEWSAMGIQWKVTFDNDWQHNVLAEEFVATLQILVTELGLSTMDLHLLQTNVYIQLKIADSWKPPSRIVGSPLQSWIIYSPIIDKEKDSQRILQQPGALLVNLKLILQEISVLPSKLLEEEITRLHQQRNLASKTLLDNLYQFFYRYWFSQDAFEQMQRNRYEPFTLDIPVKAHDALKWKDQISARYNKETSLKAIDKRYRIIPRAIHRTLAHLKDDARYSDFITDLRDEGWRDWQIMLAIMNHLNQYKIALAVKEESFAGPAEMRMAKKQKFDELLSKNEDQHYIEVPLDFFMNQQFRQQLIQVAGITLPHWDLTTNSKYPDWVAIEFFMAKRFNFRFDDKPSMSIL